MSPDKIANIQEQFTLELKNPQQKDVVNPTANSYIKIEEELFIKDEFDIDSSNSQYMDQQLCNFDLQQVQPDREHMANFGSPCGIFLRMKTDQSSIGAPPAGSCEESLSIFHHLLKKEEIMIEGDGDIKHSLQTVKLLCDINCDKAKESSTDDTCLQKSSLRTCSGQSSNQFTSICHVNKHIIRIIAIDGSDVNHGRSIIDKFQCPRDIGATVVRKQCRSMKRKMSQRHVRTSLSNKAFQCEVCGHISSRKYHLVQHIRIHTGDKPFMCEICGYCSSHKSYLLRHIRTHTGEKSYKCAICHYCASQKSHLVQHTRTHMGEKPFKCEICCYSSLRKSNLVQHIRTHTGDKPFKCEICDFCTSYKSQLVQHSRTHTGGKPFKCGICDFGTSYKSRLVQHIRTHTGGKPFKCGICGYCTCYKFCLVPHMRIHMGEKPFNCKICVYSASKKSHMIEHIRIHTGDRPYMCEICGYSALSKSKLTRHIKTHTGDKPFKCDICDYRALRKSTLMKHIKTHSAKNNSNVKLRVLKNRVQLG